MVREKRSTVKYTNSKLVNAAKELRKQQTLAENILWRHLRGRRFEDLKFRRQQPIGDYIADFVCFEKRLVIEVDGGQHTSEKDSVRDKWFEEQGFRILRFWNNEVLSNLDAVLEMIRIHISESNEEF